MLKHINKLVLILINNYIFTKEIKALIKRVKNKKYK
jgi:hypothetical protein